MSDAEGPSIDALLADSEWIRGLARSLVGEARADDVVQDLWLSALERGPRSAASARGWLGTVLRNSVRRLHRADASRAGREAQAARRDEPTSTLEVVERFSTQQAVAAAVLELPVVVRDAILLRFYEDLPLREIATRQGVSIAGAEKRVTRGLELLRRVLEARLGTRDRHWTAVLLPLAGLPRGSRAALVPAKVGAALAIAVLVLTALRTVLSSTRGEDLAPDVLSTARGSEPALLDTDSVAREDAARSAGRAALATAAASVAALEPAPGAIRVRIVDTARPDAAREDTGQAVLVTLRPAAGFLPAGGARVARCDARGSTVFDGLRPGPWQAESDRGGACAVRVEPSSSLDVELTLPEGPPLSGRVVDVLGHGVPGATVWLSPRAAESATPLCSFVDDVAAIRTDEHGRFRIGSLGAARTIGARAPGLAPSADVALDPWTDALAELSLVLPGPGAALSGVVLGRGSEPLDGASVYVDAAGEGAHELRTTSDARGAFRFDSVAPGARRLVVCAGGFAPLRERVSVAAREERELVLAPCAGFTVEGRITDAGGRALAGASLFAARRPWTVLPDERCGVTTESDAAGRYRLAGVPPGAAWLVVQTEGAGRSERLVEGEEGGELVLDLCLPPPLRLEGRVVDELGRGIAGCTLVVLAPDEWPPRRVAADEAGRFALEVDDDLAHQVWIEERGVQLARPIAARPQEGEVEIRLFDAERPTAGLAGVLVDELGHPLDVRGLHLRVSDERGVARDVSTRDEGSGRFRVEALLPGVWTVQLLRRGRPPRRIDGSVTLAAFETVDLGCLAEPAVGDRP